MSDPAGSFRSIPSLPHRGALLASANPDLDAHFGRFVERHHVPGLAYGVVVDGALAHSAGVGRRSLTDAAPPGPGTVYRIASMTKSFTAMVVLILRDEGLLRLDDPVAGHVPELGSLQYPTTDSPPITVRDLLSMSSGLVEDDAWGDRRLDMDAETFGRVLAGGLDFDLAPSTAYEYSNLGYAILGRVVASVTQGVGLRDLSRTRIFEPLGMTATTWDADRVDAGVAAPGYRVEGGEWVPEPTLADGAFGAMGGLASSIEDLARYVALHLSAWPPRDEPDTGPLRRSSLREMAQAHRAGPTYLSAEAVPATPFVSDGYGYGLVSALHPHQGRVVAHSGGLPGYASHMEWLPDCGVGIVALANRTYVPVKAAVREAFDILAATGALQVRALPPSTALRVAQDAIVGLYERWDGDVAAGAMLDTYFLDRDDDHRAPDFERLRATHGACRAVGEMLATGAQRGTWRMTCEHGVLDVSVMLGPIRPSRIQFITVTPVDVTPARDPSGAAATPSATAVP